MNEFIRRLHTLDLSSPVFQSREPLFPLIRSRDRIQIMSDFLTITMNERTNAYLI